MRLIVEICDFLTEHGFSCSNESIGNMSVIITELQKEPHEKRVIIPVILSATEIDSAQIQQSELRTAIEDISKRHDTYPLIITRDRWQTQREMMHKRILSHLEIFFPIYARNCEVRRIEKAEAAEFLKKTHTYADAACRYRYGLFLKRHTGHISDSDHSHEYKPGTLVAVATFSNARKWIKNGMEIKSYEWTRYASLPEIRVSGGMGKLLKSFIKDVQPDDIMSYADLEWSEGSVYSQLGFTLEGEKAPVMFEVDDLWHRRPYGKQHESQERKTIAYFRNFGSNKYRFKITQYE
jgi:hypothetical protein